MVKNVAETEVIDQEKMQALLGRIIGDFGATASSALVVIGDRLGLYKALASDGPLTSVELAKRTNITERYVREWLINQAASGYIEYNPATGAYSLTPEQRAALADDANPLFVAGGFELFISLVKDEEHVAEMFRSGEGMRWATIMPACSGAPSVSSALAIWPTSHRTGFPRWLACARSWKQAQPLPMSAVDMARQRRSWQTPTRSHASSASTITPRLSRPLARRLQRRGWLIACRSRWQAQLISPAPAMS